MPGGGSSRFGLESRPPADRAPGYTESLRQARESTDSIFHVDDDDEDDSLFGGHETPRKAVVPVPPGGPRGSALADSSQQTMRVPGLADFPPPILGATPMATRATFVPEVLKLPPDNPFEDLTSDITREVSNDPEPWEDTSDDSEELEERSRPFSWKNWVIGGLVIYCFLITGLAAWGWLRTPDFTKSQPAAAAGKP